mgnify:CR=1 FL=1
MAWLYTCGTIEQLNKKDYSILKLLYLNTCNLVQLQAPWDTLAQVYNSPLP